MGRVQQVVDLLVVQLQVRHADAKYTLLSTAAGAWTTSTSTSTTTTAASSGVALTGLTAAFPSCLREHLVDDTGQDLCNRQALTQSTSTGMPHLCASSTVSTLFSVTTKAKVETT